MTDRGQAESVAKIETYEPTANTVYIDSDEENDAEAEILRQNFFLSYSDHNYDCANPEERRKWPKEDPFPIIEGLDEHGNITKQYMPERNYSKNEEGTSSSSLDPQQPKLSLAAKEEIQSGPTIPVIVNSVSSQSVGETRADGVSRRAKKRSATAQKQTPPTTSAPMQTRAKMVQRLPAAQEDYASDENKTLLMELSPIQSVSTSTRMVLRSSELNHPQIGTRVEESNENSNKILTKIVQQDPTTKKDSLPLKRATAVLKKKPRTSYKDLAIEAVQNLKEENGTTVEQIENFIHKKYTFDSRQFQSSLRTGLKRAVDAKLLVCKKIGKVSTYSMPSSTKILSNKK